MRYWIVVCVLMGLVGLASAQPACTHYAAQTGTGSVCSFGTPCLIMTFLNDLTLTTTPGNVLCLNDGVYTGPDSRITVQTTFAGANGNPIWIRAINEGQVIIDGQGARPVQLRGSWGVLWGINIRNGDNHNISFAGSHWVAQRIVAWNSVGSGGNIALGGTDNLAEDVAAFGRAEKQIIATTNNQAITNNVVRRGFGIFQDTGPFDDPTNAGETGYGQDNVTFENMIFTWDRTGTDGDPEGLFQTFRCDDCKVLGTIIYVKAGAVFDSTSLFFALTDAGSQEAAGNYDPSSNNVITHILSYIDPAYVNFNTKRALRFEYNSPGPPGSNNIVSNLVGVSGLTYTCTAPHWTCSDIQQGTSLADAIGAGNSVWTQSNAAPGICKRYINGVLTSEPLWPWPMNQRIIDAMTTAGVTPINVTDTLETLLGTIPSECLSGAPPPPAGEPPLQSGSFFLF